MWGATARVRKPFVRRVDNHILRIVMRANDQGHGPLLHEMNFALDSVVRELVRLQMQVEELQQVVLDVADRRADLSIVDPEDELQKIAG